jgi:hypothetical protein
MPWNWLADVDLGFWPLLAMGIFLALFVAVVVRLGLGLRDRDEAARLAHLAQLPLENDAAAVAAPRQEVRP